MKINDLVTISPHHSLKFADMVGTIRDIKPEDGLCLKIQFTENGRLYGFSTEEVISVKD